MPKTILISGGSDGLGKAIATKLSPSNQVIILSHNREKLVTVSKEIGCDFVEADVTDALSLGAAIDTVLKKYQKIDVLINNAGIWIQGSLEDNEVKQIQEVINVNTLGTILLTKSVLPSMKAAKGGRIINIISQDGLHAKENRSVYTASKWAITGFTHCLQNDLAGDKIGVTGIYPGLMKTGLFEKQGADRDLSEALDPSEVASVVEYVINLLPNTLIPDIGIKNINQITNMDDSGSPQIGLDLNPDMITPQTGIPQSTFTPPTTPDILPDTPGVIDITPGVSSSEEVHPEKVEDISPALPVAPTVSESVIDTQELKTSSGVIDITPGKIDSPEPVAVENPVADSGVHLVDVVPQTDTPSATVPSVTAVPTPVDTPLEAGSIAVELPPSSPTNPLQEDPDLVKLNK